VRIAWTIALGLLRRRGTALLRTSAVAAVSAVALGIAALVVVLALMNGYREALRKGILSGSGHVVALFPAAPGEAERQRLYAAAAKLDGTTGLSEALYLPGLLVGSAGRCEAVQVKAARTQAPFVHLQPSEGGPLGVAIGAGLASSLGLCVGQLTSVQLFLETRGLAVVPVRVEDVFASGFAELDDRWVFAPLSGLEARLPGVAPSAFEIFLANPDRAEVARRQLEDSGVRGVLLTTWEEGNRSLFAALRWQKLSLLLVLSLVVGVGAFEVASALVVLVTEKRRDIGVILAMGGTPSLVREVLLVAGGAMGAAGVLIGLALGVLVTVLMGWLGQPHFPREIASIYMVEKIPFLVRPADLGLVGAVGLAEVVLAAWMPAVRTAAREPSEVLRWV